MRALRDRVLSTLRAHDLWGPGDRVTVAVSGGLDSIALLYLLHATRGVHGGILDVITVDHGTRPGSADDAAFVLATAASLDLPCTVAPAAASGDSEDALRTARYAVLDAHPTDRVALAHHRDDQAETVLLNLLRGTGPVGLRGMSWRRDRYVRPLLGTPRADLHAYADAIGLRWRDDPTNASPRYLRNRIRHEVLPLLEDLRPGAAGALARSAALATEQQDWIDGLVAEAPQPLTVTWLRDAPAPLARQALLARWPRLSNAQVRDLLAAARRGHGTITLEGGIEVKVEGDSWVSSGVEP